MEVAEPDAQSRPQRSRGVWIATVVVVALISAIGIVLVTRNRDDGERTGQASNIPLPSPHTIVRNGVTYSVQLIVTEGAARDPADPRSVRVFAPRISDARHPVCATLAPSARVVSETTDSVTVATFGYQSSPRPTGIYECSYDRVGDESLNAGLTLHLRSPLAARKVVDARSGEVVGLIDRDDLPTPSYVPAGYKAAYVQRFDPPADLEAIRQYRRGKDIFTSPMIQIMVLSQTQWTQPSAALGKADINGHAATITETRWSRCVTWTDPPGIVRNVCSSARHAQLALDELLRLARSLH
jgi:hypothetical protein